MFCRSTSVTFICSKFSSKYSTSITHTSSFLRLSSTSNLFEQLGRPNVPVEPPFPHFQVETPSQKFSEERALPESLSADCQRWEISTEKGVGKSGNLEEKCGTPCIQKRVNGFLPVIESPEEPVGATIFVHDHDNPARVVESNQVQHFCGQQDGVRDGTSSLTAALNRILANEMGGMSSSHIGREVKKLCGAGQLMEALRFLDLMDLQGIEPHSETYMDLLQGCISGRALSEGRRVHSHILKSSFKSSLLLEKALINMYSKCGSILDAYKLFSEMPDQDLFTWTIIIVGFVCNGSDEEALGFFCQMEQEGLKPDAVTISSVLKACANLQALDMGVKLHIYIVKSGYDSDLFLCSALMDMYAKCGSIENAQSVFNKMQKKNVYSWSVMIAGYAQNGQAEEALKLVLEMMQDCVEPNEVTLTSVLKACACLGNLDQGKQIHIFVIESAINQNIVLLSTLIDMYSKCGSLKDAHRIFNKIPIQNLVSWNVMIGAYAQHGLAEEAFELLNQMQQEDMKGDGITFAFILSACSHVGFLDIGYQKFNSMIQKHAITPHEEHYTCMVDLLSRAGCLEETVYFIENMPCQPTAAVWMSLLSACRLCGDVKLGEQAADFVRELEPVNVSSFVLLSNIYAERQVT